jgi:MFS family permease
LTTQSQQPASGLDHLSWVVTAYLLAATVSTPLYGKLGDLYGRKLVFQAAIVIFLAGSALAGLSQSMAELIAFRAVQGLGGGGLMVTAQAIIADVVSPRERGRYMGYFGAVFGGAMVAGASAGRATASTTRGRPCWPPGWPAWSCSPPGAAPSTPGARRRSSSPAPSASSSGSPCSG